MPSELVVMGGSKGAFEALREILGRLPRDYGPPLIVVLHQYRHSGRSLAQALATFSAVPVLAVEDKDPIDRGHIFVCPANYHVLVENQRTFALSTDPPVNFARPSIDVLFESAARVYGDGVVGVLLSGSSDDGAKGLAAIRARGGAVMCQDPATAPEPTLPRAGCEAARVEWTGSPERIGMRLVELDR